LFFLSIFYSLLHDVWVVTLFLGFVGVI
jgi:hypothetical protein